MFDGLMDGFAIAGYLLGLGLFALLAFVIWVLLTTDFSK